jgi:ornithine decarboxylase
MPPTNIINVGGAFKANPLSDEIGATVNDAIQEFLPDDKSFEVIAEPRRYFCETAFTL